MLVIIVVMLVFTFSSFGVDSNSVIDGYNSSRVYATKTKAMQASIDVFKSAVNGRIELLDTVDNLQPSTVDTLGAYGTLLSNEEYEAYTASLPDIPASYPEGTTGALSGGYGVNVSDKDIPVAAYFDKYVNYLSKTGNADNSHLHESGGSSANCRTLYGAGQCAGFADWYINQVGYGGVGSTDSDFAVKGARTYNQNLAVAWEARSTKTFGTADEAKKFFEGVTPGTFVRNYTDIHSYIILGASTDALIVYDCNWGGRSNNGGKCNISLRQVSWDTFMSAPQYCSGIKLIVAPKGTNLPKGCYDPMNDGVCTTVAQEAFDKIKEGE